MSLVGMAGDGHDLCLREGRNLAKLPNEMTSIHVRHCQVDQHQIGPKYGCNVECRRSAIGHMHMVAEFFNEQAKRVRAVSIVIDHENPKSFPCPWHKFSFFRQSHGLSPVVNRRPFYLIRGRQVAFSGTSAKICRTFSKSAGLTK